MRNSSRRKERSIAIVLAVLLVAVVALVVARRKFMPGSEAGKKSMLFKTENVSSLEAIFAEDVVSKDARQPELASESVVRTPAAAVPSAAPVVAASAGKVKGVPGGTDINVSVGGNTARQDSDEGVEDGVPVKETGTAGDLLEPLPLVEEVEVVEPVPVEPKGPRKYVVQTGDNLSTISQKFYGKTTRWRLIQDANGLQNPNRLRIGMELLIPDENASVRREPVEIPAQKPDVRARDQEGNGRQQNSDSYIVKRNDSLWTIAVAAYGDGTKWRSVFEANRDKIANKDALRVGQVLKIP